jgi:hypothetical protein
MKDDGLAVHRVRERRHKGTGVLGAVVRVEEDVNRDHEVDVDGDFADIVREAVCEVMLELLDRFRRERACGQDSEHRDESHEKRTY